MAGLVLASLLLASRGSAGPAEPGSPPVPATAIHLGESDSAILRRMPPVDVQVLLAAETAAEVPPLLLTADSTRRWSSAAGGAALDMLLDGLGLPATMLMYSGDWYGARLEAAAKALGLSLSSEQLDILEAVAVSRGVNTRWLLALASAKRATVQTLTSEDWAKWLYLEAWRARTALAGTDGATPFRDGTTLSSTSDTEPARALLLSLSAGTTPAGAEGAVAAFVEAYAGGFGDPAMDEAQPAATTPFLYQPSTVPLTGRGYFDHAFPTVDFGGWPNSAGMLDYLGRTTTNYDTHDGDDLWMPFGSPVVAPVNGTVLWVDTIGPDYGLLIRVPGSTYDIVIVHLSDLWVASNSVVTRGQPIGRSGQAGATRPIPHIHFEVRHNGRQTDTRGWYGSGADPCPAGGSGRGYSGCEASMWLWADEAPPRGSTAPLPPCPPAPVAPIPPVGPGSAVRVLLPFVINAAGSCRPR